MRLAVCFCDWVNHLARIVEATCSRDEVLNSLQPQEPEFFGEFTSSIAILVAERERRDATEVASDLCNRMPQSFKDRTQVVRPFLNVAIHDFTDIYSAFTEIQEPQVVVVHVLPPTKAQSWEGYSRLIARAIFFLLRCAFSGQRAFLRLGALDSSNLVEIDRYNLSSVCKLFVDIIASRREVSELQFFNNEVRGDVLNEYSQGSTLSTYLWLLPNTFSQQDFRSMVARVKSSGGAVWVPANSWAELSSCPFSARKWYEWDQDIILNFISYLAGDTLSQDFDYHVPLFEERANSRWWWRHTLNRLDRVLGRFSEFFESESGPRNELLGSNSVFNYGDFGEGDFLQIASFWCRLPSADKILGRTGNLSLQLKIEHSLLLIVHRVLNYSSGEISKCNILLLQRVLNLIKQDRYWLRLCQ